MMSFGSMGSGGDGLDSYAKGVYEHRDGAPIDISNCYSDRNGFGGSGETAYADGWDRIFAKKTPKPVANKTMEHSAKPGQRLGTKEDSETR